MNNTIMYGKPVANDVKEAINEKITGKKLTLGIILVGDDQASHLYMERLAKNAQVLGIAVKKVLLPETVTQEETELVLEQLNKDAAITGILPLMPLPKRLDAKKICAKLNPAKDVDCLNPLNAGEFFLGTNKWAPGTPRACLAILKFYGINPAGKNVVVLGRSNVVGKPLALLLMQQDATVTICHSKTKNLPAIVAGGDIVIAAMGRAGFVTPEMVKQGAVLVDVGINVVKGKLCGDISPEAYAKAYAYTPVPGGVGVVSNFMVLASLTR